MILARRRGGESMTNLLTKWFSRKNVEAEEVEIGADMVPSFDTLDARYAEIDRLTLQPSSSRQSTSPFTTTVSGPVR